MTDKVFHYVRHHEVPAFLDLGWIAHPKVLDGLSHGDYSMFMEWPFEDRQPEKPRGAANVRS